MMMNDDLLNAFDDCLAALAAGETPEACLARHPQWAADLRPMLKAAHRAATLPPSAAALKTMRAAQDIQRAAFLKRAAQLRAAARPSRFSAIFARRALAPVLALLVFIGLSTYGAVRVSADSLPGDAFYGVKRTVEQAQLFFAFNPQTRVTLEEDLTQRRADEARTVTAQGRATAVEFGGTISQMQSDRWTVAGVTVLINAETQLEGAPAIGAFVTIAGRSQPDGAVLAAAVQVDSEEFSGVVNAIGAEAWLIEQTRVRVSAQTTITGDPHVGDAVAVTARRLSDGQPLALTIQLTEPGPAATPSAEPTETEAAATAEPTQPAEATDSFASEVEFSGAVETIGAEVWRIGGQSVRVTAQTEINGNPHVGDTVKVNARRAANGDLTAVRIQRVEAKASPTPGPTHSQTLEPTHEPKRTPEVTHPADQPSRTPEATHPAEKPSRTPEPTHATEAPHATETPHPQELEMEGVVLSINGNQWQIGEHTVFVTPTTVLENNPRVGDAVDVRAWRNANGQLIATHINKK
jgi:hypothetical protein